MNIEGVRVGPLQTNCYVAYDDTACVVFDPGYDADAIMRMLDGRKLDLIILTHGHMDHIGGLPSLVSKTGAPIVAHEKEVSRVLHPERGMYDNAYVGYKPVKAVDRAVKDGDIVEVGDLSFKIMHTPGHTVGSMCIYYEAEGVLFSGDTLFRGAHGRTDFNGGNPHQMKESLARLIELPDATLVLPGHEGQTTISNEKRWIVRRAL